MNESEMGETQNAFQIKAQVSGGYRLTFWNDTHYDNNKEAENLCKCSIILL